jgi:hypothetical protein
MNLDLTDLETLSLEELKLKILEIQAIEGPEHETSSEEGKT